jgi:hypothetical protein
MVPADFDTTNNQERLVDIVAFFITDTQTSVLMQPRKTAFNYPTVNSQAAAVLSSALGKQRYNPFSAKLSTMWFAVIGPVSQCTIRTFNRPANLACDWGYAIDQWHQLCDIMTVGTSQFYRKRDAISVCYQMVFRALFAAIRGVWTGFCPPKTARTEPESTTARQKSILSACRSLLNRIWWILFHTPAFCQSRRRRQQVIPEPQPICSGKSSQAMPVLSTKRIPVSAARSGIGFLPGYRNLRFFFGINGSIIFHNWSSSIGLAMSSLLAKIRCLSYSCYRRYRLNIFHFVRGSKFI